MGYYTLPHFLNLLETQNQHLTRIDQFDDHFEGIWPAQDISLLDKMTGFSVKTFTEFMSTRTVASCWHRNQHESASKIAKSILYKII